MLRAIFVSIIVVIGTFYALISPFYALLFYLWHAYFRPEEWIWWLDLAQFHISLIVGVYVVFRTLISAPRIRPNLGSTLVLLFLGQSVLCTVTSEHPSMSLDFLSEFAKVLLITCLIVVLVTDRKKFRLTLLVMSLSLGLECAKQGWVNLILNPGAQNSNTIGFLGDNNDVALGTMMLVPIFGALARSAATRPQKFAYLFIGLGVFFRGVFTYSRGGFLAGSALGLLTLLRSPAKTRALLGVGVVAALLWTVMPDEFWDRMQSITASSEDRDSSAAGRLYFWKVGLKMADNKPLTGVGLNGFEASYGSYGDTREFGDNRAAHSTWFGTLGDLGYPGLALLVLNWSVAIGYCWKVSSMARRNPALKELDYYAKALFTSLVVFAVAATFLTDQYNEMFWHFMGLSTTLYLVAQSEVAAIETKPAIAAPAFGPAAAMRA